MKFSVSIVVCLFLVFAVPSMAVADDGQWSMIVDEIRLTPRATCKCYIGPGEEDPTCVCSLEHAKVIQLTITLFPSDDNEAAAVAETLSSDIATSASTFQGAHYSDDVLHVNTRNIEYFENPRVNIGETYFDSSAVRRIHVNGMITVKGKDETPLQQYVDLNSVTVDRE